MASNPNRRRIYAMAESTPGTFVGSTSLFVAANCKTRVYSLEVAPKIESEEMKPLGETMDSRPSVVWGESGEIKFSHPMYTMSSLGTAPFYGLFLKGCKAKETVTASTSIAYTPDSFATTRLSIGIEEIDDNGSATRRYAFCGCLGTFDLKAEAGKALMLEYTFQGAMAYDSSVLSELDSTVITSIPYENDTGARLPQFKSVTWSADGYAHSIGGFTFTRGLEVALSVDVANATTIGQARGDDASPKVTFDAAKVSKASYAFLGKLKGGTVFGVMAVAGAAGNQIQFDGSAAQYESLGDADRAGQATYQASCRLHGTLDSSWSITIK